MRNDLRREPPGRKGFEGLGRIIVILVIFAILGYYLLAEHKAHLLEFFGSVPWWVILILLCPLMHFMHGGHGKHHDHDKENKGADSSFRKDD